MNLLFVLLGFVVAVSASLDELSPVTPPAIPVHDTYTPVLNSLKPDIKRFVDRFPTLKRLVDSKTSQSTLAIKKITGRGFNYFSHSASMQAIEGVEAKEYDNFVKYMITTLAIPGDQANSVKKELFDVIRFSQNSDWLQHNLMFSVNKGGATKYICILGHSNFGKKTYDFVIADMKTSFMLAPDLMVVTERKSALWGLIQYTKRKVIKIPATLKDSEVEALANFFDLAAFTSFAKMLNVPMSSAMSSLLPAESFADPVSIMAAIGAGVKLWGEIANAFKTKITNEIVKTIVRNGFDFFVSRSKAHIIEKMQGIHFDQYVNAAVGLYGIPANFANDFKTLFMIAKFSNGQTWNKNDMLFKMNTIGTNKFINLVTKNNREKPDYKQSTFNILVVNCEQQLRLAPNLVVFQQSRSILGGIYEDNKITFREQARELTQKDVQIIMKFFHIITFKRFAINLGITIKAPNPQIIM